MLRHVEGEERAAASSLLAALGLSSSAAAPVTPLAQTENEPSRLPPDHPQWAKDTVTISNRAREFMARLKPVVVRVLTFWDHRVRALVLGDARICIDPSGSYRRE